MADADLKKLSELRVLNLRALLEKRNLDKNGVKHVLLQRMREVLISEGYDPDKQIFKINPGAKPNEEVVELVEENFQQVQPRKKNIVPGKDGSDVKLDIKQEPIEEVVEESLEELADNSLTSSEHQYENEIYKTKLIEKQEPTGEAMEVEIHEQKQNHVENFEVVDLTEDKQNEIEYNQIEQNEITENMEEGEYVEEAEPGTKENTPLNINDGSCTTEREETNTYTSDVNKFEENIDQLNSVYSSNTLEEGEEEHESPIRLTLDDDESLQDDNEGAEKMVDEESIDDKKKKEDQGKQKNDTAQSENVRSPDNHNRKPVKKLSSHLTESKGEHIVWVSNVAKNSLATDLQAALSVYGKVKEVKVLVNGKYPGASCFGHVTLASSEDANNVIDKLNNTELNGHIIKIERFDKVRADQLKLMKDSKHGTVASKHKPDSEKKDGVDNKREREKKVEVKEKTHVEDKAAKDKHSIAERHSSERTKREDPKKPLRKERRRSRSVEKHRERDVLTFARIKEERERERRRERERALREESRRRRAESLRQKEIDRRHRQESMRLEREKEKLRIEKEKIEREKAELLRMERERHRLEREKIARQKIELARTLMRLEEDRRSIKRPAAFRNSSERFQERKRTVISDNGDRHRLEREKSSRTDDRFDDRKRTVSDRHFDAPPPPRFDNSQSKARDHSPKKFSGLGSKDHYSKPRNQYDSSDNTYPEKRNRDFSEPSRYDQRGSLLWSSQTKTFSGSNVSKSWDKTDWRSTNSDRGLKTAMPATCKNPQFQFEPTNTSDWQWNSSSQGNTSTARQYTGNSTISAIPPMCPPPPGINNYSDMRYDYAKHVGNSVRKY